MVLRPQLTLVVLSVLLLSGTRASGSAQENPGDTIYRAACAACHGVDGKGVPSSVLGFEPPVPDFTDCTFATPEAEIDWIAVVHQGGPVRAFDRMMPAFGDALTEEEIQNVVRHVRGFCDDDAWPRGELNLPRPFLTEKAFPENETVVTIDAAGGGPGSFVTEFLYEQRIGARSQFEIVVPFEQRDGPAGNWSRGLGDVAIAFKHAAVHSLSRGSILSAGTEVVLPTGKEDAGLGGGTTVIEPFAAFGQILPGDGFVHVHAGLAVPLASGHSNEVFWRVAAGKTIVQGQWGRAWSPMVELVADRELADNARTAWDLVPQMQIALSTRQHLIVNAGVRIPTVNRAGRHPTVLAYLLWDWFDGGFFEGW